MKKSTILTTALALFAALTVVALPAAAQTADQATVTSAAPETAPALFEPAPIEQAKPVCQPGEHEFNTIFRFFYLEEDCQPLCDGYCQDNGGYLYSWSYDFRGLSCYCTCCG